MTVFYHIMSFLLLCFIAERWSMVGASNLLVKLIFIGTAALGAVTIAKDFVQ